MRNHAIAVSDERLAGFHQIRERPTEFVAQDAGRFLKYCRSELAPECVKSRKLKQSARHSAKIKGADQHIRIEGDAQRLTASL